MSKPLIISFASKGREDYLKNSETLYKSVKEHWKYEYLFYTMDGNRHVDSPQRGPTRTGGGLRVGRNKKHTELYRIPADLSLEILISLSIVLLRLFIIIYCGKFQQRLQERTYL